MYDHYHGLIFDMDGTLLDTERPHIRAWKEILAKYGMKYDYEAWLQYNGSPTLKVAKMIIESHQSDIDPAVLTKEKMALVEQYVFDEVTTLPTFDVVKKYHGIKPMAIGTGSTHQMAERLLNHLGVRHYFDVIVGSDDVKEHKPSPETFLKCANLLNVAPEKCVVFEDADFGIQAALAANMSYVDVRVK